VLAPMSLAVPGLRALTLACPPSSLGQRPLGENATPRGRSSESTTVSSSSPAGLRASTRSPAARLRSAASAGCNATAGAPSRRASLGSLAKLWLSSQGEAGVSSRSRVPAGRGSAWGCAVRGCPSASARGLALSTDGGLTFRVIANISKADLPGKKAGGDNRGLFRFVDQPTITAAHGEVWVVFNAGGPMAATGAPVSGPGQVGGFIPLEVVPGTNNCTYGDVAIGPSGQVMQACALTESGQGGGKIFVNTDPDGLGPAGFGKRTFVTQTHVGGFDFIPAQPDRSVDSEPGLAWDRTGGPHNGRVYLVYTREHPNESNNTDIYVRHSDDNGATWSTPVRVNDDHTTNSQFLPKISLDPTTGNIAVVWYDSRNDLGAGGPGDTDGLPNDDAQFWGAFSANGGASFTRNIQISAGTSNSHDSGNGIDYGDYSGLSFYGGIAHPAWSDNSNSTGNNPDGALHQLDIYTAAVPAP
jgi:hypothetical protein